MRTRMRNAAIAPKMEIPFEGSLRQAVRSQLLFEKLNRSRAFAAANHFAVAFRRQHVNPERILFPFRIALHIESLNYGGVMMDHHGPVGFFCKISFFPRAQITPPLHIIVEPALL